MQRILVLNPKGGSGKTTIAITLASHFAVHGERPVLMDYDRQGSAAHWHRKREATAPPIHLITAYELKLRVTRSFQLRIPRGTGRVVIDTPAALSSQDLPDLTRSADKILIPLLPSDIDFHACSQCVETLVKVAKVAPADHRVGIIANRVRRNTPFYHSLRRFVESLGLPLVASLRDSQNYLRAGEKGLGLQEMTLTEVANDLSQWQPLLQWLDQTCDASATVASPVTEAVAINPPPRGEQLALA